MDLLVYEHVAGGGFADEKIPTSALSEGYGMLTTLISDFKAAGYNVTTLLDSRLKASSPPIEADNIIPISSQEELDKALEKLPRAVDAVYTIAPESNDVLQRLVKTVEMSGGISLNCQVDAIDKASNKMTTYEILKKNGLRVPDTLTINVHENVKRIRRMTSELKFPLVIKPLDGVGCSGLSVVQDENQIVVAVKRIKEESSNQYYIAQRFIQGVAASVSLISTGEEALPITLNKQKVNLAPPNSNSSYNGGIVPLSHLSEREALEAAQMAVKSLRGLRGYVGVDMVLTRNGPVVMEVNPRLTTSYVGLREVVDFNSAQAIIDAVLWQKLPENVQSSGYAFFSKVKVPPTRQLFLETYRLKEVISPPFPIATDEPAYALLATHSSTLKNAQAAFYRARRRLLKLFHGGD